MDLHEFELTPRGRRAVHGLLAGARAPARHAGGHALAAARRDRPAGRRPHRARRLGVARARAHPARGVLRHAGQQRVLRRLPHQLDPGRCRAAACCISARDTSALYQRRPARRGASCGRSAARRATSGSARGARFWFQHDARMLAGRPDQPLRRRGRAAAEGARLARAGPGARPPPAPRDGGAQLPPRSGHLGPERGQRADAPRRQRVRRLRVDAVLLRVHAGRAAAVRRPAARRRRELPGPAGPVARDAAHPARARGAAHGPRARRRLRELERRDERPALAGAGGREGAPLAPLASGARRGFETRLDVATTATRLAVRALGAAGRRLATSAPAAAP